MFSRLIMFVIVACCVSCASRPEPVSQKLNNTFAREMGSRQH
jgi:hypothetical protein